MTDRFGKNEFFHNDGAYLRTIVIVTMTSRQRTVDYIMDQIAKAGTVYARKMFGEYAIYCDTKVVALVCDDQLFVKPTAAGRAFIGNVVEGIPYSGAKPYLLISGEEWNDQQWLAELIRISAEELPLPKQKKPAKSRSKKGHLH